MEYSIKLIPTLWNGKASPSQSMSKCRGVFFTKKTQGIVISVSRSWMGSLRTGTHSRCIRNELSGQRDKWFLSHSCRSFRPNIYWWWEAYAYRKFNYDHFRTISSLDVQLLWDRSLHMHDCTVKTHYSIPQKGENSFCGYSPPTRILWLAVVSDLSQSHSLSQANLLQRLWPFFSIFYSILLFILKWMKKIELEWESCSGSHSVGIGRMVSHLKGFVPKRDRESSVWVQIHLLQIDGDT